MLTTSNHVWYIEVLNINGGIRPCQSGDFFMPSLWGMRTENILNIGQRPLTFSESPTSHCKRWLLKINGVTMHKALTIFNYQNNQIRTKLINNEPYFCGLDVCKILGIKNNRDTITRLHDGVVIADTTDSLGRQQSVSYINEPNLYKVAFQSRKPTAEPFVNWVCKEVLPSIRKTGAYVTPAQQELGLVPVSSYTRRLPSGPREIKLSDKARSEIGGIVKACIGSALKDITVTQTVDPIGYNIPESLKQPDVVPAEVEKELWRLTEQLHYGLQKQQPKAQNTSVLNLFYLLRALKTVLTRYRTVQNETLFAVDMMKGDKNYEKDEALERIYILNALTNGALRVC